ncbi:MAG: cytochrome C [Gammaproteobacteria bacterium]|jgi:hydroxylamine dehydrogenase|nr:cytochrome C [Gammaproteobacteria bacterium]MBT4606231.1 cytochrome C [Thiotrichales bacterium]MBT3473115.1 cytochrome C [Gammaproteobacteria bacterium]MBT3968370.1 cytochrome C [Gammaproteobacteria bacterium]MBT4081836.1 cytochrome C [Gammaproteobacteria bacterium]
MPKKTLQFLFGLLFAISASTIHAASKDTSDEDNKLNGDCIGCHYNVTPGIVKQHLESPMANAKKHEDSVSCTDCHGESHVTNDDYAKAAMPTMETCAECHKKETKQYKKGKHNLAWFGMKSQIAWHGQPGAIVDKGYKGCSGCHKLGKKGILGIADGKNELTHDNGKEAADYRYGNAQCDACHTRHTFSQDEARDPRACSNCHMGFDHPQWEMFMSSKHGIIWSIEDQKGERDGRAPTCQKCHMNEGDHEVTTAWGFLGLRIPTQKNVLALIDAAPSLEQPLRDLAKLLPTGSYIDVDDDPQWVLDRALILQAAGILDSGLQPTERFVEIVVQGRAARAPEEFNALRTKMKNICNECHSKGFVQEHFVASDNVIKAADHEFAKAIAAVQALYKDGILEKPEGWDFAPDLLHYYDAKTNVEQELYLIMLEYRQRAFQGAFHASNDYMHWYGWAPLKTAVNNILQEAKQMRAEHEAKQKH